MQRFILTLALILAFSTSLTGQTSHQQHTPKVSHNDSASNADKPRRSSHADSSHTQHASVQPNRALIGAVVESVTLLDGQHYKISLELRTAIPVDGLESLAEPGQHIIAVPSYLLNKKGVIDSKDARNKRLIDARLLKAGDFLFGKITFGKDGLWYLLDTKLE